MTTPARILITEDELLVAADLKSRLTSLGYEVAATAPTGEEAVTQAVEARPDLVLMDIRLGSGIDGIEAAERIHDRLQVPIVYLTAYADDDTLRRAKTTQPFGYILKPFEARELRTTIEMALYKHALERKLRDREQWLTTTLKSIGEGVITTDAQARVTFMNPVAEALTGWTQAEALEASLSRVLKVVDETTREPIPCPAANAMQALTTFHFSQRACLIRRDGREFLVDDCAAPIVDEDGCVIGAVVVFRDMSDRRRAEEALRRAQKMDSLAILAGGVAHDFNNLLVAILGQISLAMAKLPPEAPARGHVAKAINATERAAELTQQMLAYSGRGQFHTRRLDLNAFLREQHTVFEAAILRHVRLRVEGAETALPIEADAEQVQQAVMNLILNAAEAVGERTGTITLTTGAQRVEAAADTAWPHTGEPIAPGLYATLSVRDDGAGMDAETLGKIFDPFFTTKFTGRGLGLPAVLGILRGHKGGVQVTSRLGQGSTFTLYFPSIRDKGGWMEDEEKSAPASFILHPASCILVIDDEEPVREAVADILDSAGIRVIGAASGAGGLALYRERQVDIRLVLLDLSMPGMNGEATCRELQTIYPDARVVLSSGYSESEAKQRFAGMRLAGYIQKPYDADTLIKAIRGFLK